MNSTNDLLVYTLNGLSLSLRRRYEQAEKMIMEEVQTAYAWDFPITAALDIGAHIGAWTLEAKRRHPKAHIMAVEADGQNYAVLAHNVAAQDAVWIAHARCGYTDGDVVIGRHRYNSGSHRVYARADIDAVLAANPNWEFVSAPPLRSPEWLIQSITRPIDVLKIDCEGCEVDIFNHISDPLLHQLQHIVGEIHTCPADFEAATQHRLAQAGFQTVYIPHPANPQYSTFHAWH